MTDDISTKRRYERVLQTIAAQTSDAQLPGCRASDVVLTLAAHGKYSPEGVQASLKAATGTDCVRWRDDEGGTRYTLKTEPDLQRAAKWAGERGLADALTRLNPALAEVRE